MTHLLPDRPDFIQVLDRVGRVGAIPAQTQVRARADPGLGPAALPRAALNRHWTSDPGEVIAQIAPW